MADSRATFTGSIPDNYDRYLGPLIFEQYAEDLARRTARLRPRRVLEVAAGTGIATRRLRERLGPEVFLAATDLSPEMLERARAKLGALRNVELQPADATKLPYPDGAFDAVVCQFGLMFFPDRLAALREARRVLRPGGSLLTSVWDSLEHNDLIRTVVRALGERLGDGAPNFFAIPYGAHALDPTRAALETAGFHELEISIVPRIASCAAASDVAHGYLTGTPASVELARRGGVTLADAIATVTRAVALAYGDPPVGAKLQAIVFAARASPSAH